MVWLSSGGTGETPSRLCIISGKSRLRASGRAAVRLEPVLGCVLIVHEPIRNEHEYILTIL